MKEDIKATNEQLEGKYNEKDETPVDPNDPLYQYSDQFKQELRGMQKDSKKMMPKADIFSRIGNKEIQKKYESKKMKLRQYETENTYFDTPQRHPTKQNLYSNRSYFEKRAASLSYDNPNPSFTEGITYRAHNNNTRFSMPYFDQAQQQNTINKKPVYDN